MKKILFILCSGIYTFSVNAQMSVWKPSNETAYQKPPVYDSLYVNFQSFPREDAHKYLQYIGQRIYFKPLAEKAKKDFSFEDFILARDTVLRGEILKPYAQTDIAQALNMAVKDKSKSVQKQVQKQLQEKEVEYLKQFNFPTNVYKPVFTTYKQVNASGKIYARIGSDLAALENKSFIILNVYQGTSTKDTVALSKKQTMDNEKLLFMLADEKGDTLFWKTYIRQITSPNQFVIQGYYDKQVKFFKNQDLVYRKKIPNYYLIYGDRKDKNDYEKLIVSHPTFLNKTYTDINTKKELAMTDLESWKCQDVVLVEDEHTNNLYYILTSAAGSTIKIPVGELARNGFVCKQSYEKEEKMRKLKAEELEELRRQETLRFQEFQKNRMKYLVNKFGQSNASLISEGKVALGMTKEMCIEAWGETNSIVQSYRGEMWVYSYGSSLTFVGNKLVQIINL